MRFSKRTTFKSGSTVLFAVAALAATLVVGTGYSASATAKAKAPIMIGTISDGPLSSPPILSLSEVEGGIGAAVKAINAKGGIHGRMLKLVACDDASNPNTAAACGRIMVKDKVAAIVGATSGEGADFLPILAAAHIPSLGDYAVTDADLTCTTCFAMISGVSLVAGQANLAAWAGDTNISMPYLDTPAGAGIPTLASFGLAPYNLKLLNTVAVPVDAPDMSSYVASIMAGGTNGVLLDLAGSDGARFVATAEQLGFSTGITYVGDCTDMSSAISEGFAADLQGVYSVCLFLPPTDTSNSQVKAFDAQMKANNPKALKVDVAENAWAATYLFKQVASSLTTISANNVLKAMPSVNFRIGVLPPISFAKSVSPIPGFELYNNDVLLTKVQGGKFVPLDGVFIDPYVKNTLP